MAQVKQFKAKRDLTLDCGHKVKAGETFVVTKTFSCAQDARRLDLKPKQVEQK